MDPFIVMGLNADATDRQIEERYLAILKKYPPDQAPELFAIFRKAYEELKNEEDRLDRHLRYFDKTGRALTEELALLPKTLRRMRLNPQHIQALQQHCRGEIE